jgi:rubrerythrin
LVSQEKLKKFLKEQISIENQIVDSLNKAIIGIENPAVKGTLKGISLDSVKHAHMYSSALNLLTNVPKALNQKQLDEQKKVVEKHIEIELKLIKRISKELSNIDNKKIKFLLNAIIFDERKHHELLQRILEILVRGETITDEEWFDIMWKSAPFHGSPGG